MTKLRMTLRIQNPQRKKAHNNLNEQSKKEIYPSKGFEWIIAIEKRKIKESLKGKGSGEERKVELIREVRESEEEEDVERVIVEQEANNQDDDDFLLPNSVFWPDLLDFAHKNSQKEQTHKEKKDSGENGDHRVKRIQRNDGELIA